MTNKVKNIIETIKKCVEDFRNYSDDGLNQFIDEFDDSLSFPKDLSNNVEEFIKALKIISSMVENSDFIEDFFCEGEERFWDVIRGFVDNRINARKEILFIKSLHQDDFEDLFNYVFISYIIEYNELKQYKSYDEKNIAVIIKVINTMVKMIIEELYSKTLFINATKDLFGLSEKKIEFIWDLISKNKNELRYISIMNRLTKLEGR